MSGYFGILAADISSLLAQPAPLTIGDLVLQGHEVPGRISIGGAQSVTVHKMPGGRRIIDAMGVDDGSISWRGVFCGPDAAQRARMLDIMRQQGTPRVLSFGDYTFTVIIVHYEYDYQNRGAVISYRLKSEIVPDALNLADSTASTDFAAQSDLTIGQGLLQAGAAAILLQATAVGRSSMTQVSESASDLSSLATSFGMNADAAASMNMQGLAGSKTIQTALQATGTALQSAIEAAGTGSLAAPAAGLTLFSSSDLAEAAAQAAGLAALVRAAGYLNRARSNVVSAYAQAPAPLIHA